LWTLFAHIKYSSKLEKAKGVKKGNIFLKRIFFLEKNGSLKNLFWSLYSIKIGALIYFEAYIQLKSKCINYNIYFDRRWTAASANSCSTSTYPGWSWHIRRPLHSPSSGAYPYCRGTIYRLGTDWSVFIMEF
jgi:hypothetical protein